MSSWIVNERGPLPAGGAANNAKIIYDKLKTSGWTDEAIAGILGNMQAESGINPGRWENDNVGNLSGGFGLVQWTPATKLFNWQTSQAVDGDKQLERILYEVSAGIQYGDPGGEFKEKTFGEFTKSTKQPGYLAAEFMKAYERPLKQGWKQQIDRARMGEQWYETLTGKKAKKWIPVGLIIILKKGSVNSRHDSNSL